MHSMNCEMCNATYMYNVLVYLSSPTIHLKKKNNICNLFHYKHEIPRNPIHWWNSPSSLSLPPPLNNPFPNASKLQLHVPHFSNDVVPHLELRSLLFIYIPNNNDIRCGVPNSVAQNFPTETVWMKMLKNQALLSLVVALFAHNAHDAFYRFSLGSALAVHTKCISCT